MSSVGTIGVASGPMRLPANPYGQPPDATTSAGLSATGGSASQASSNGILEGITIDRPLEMFPTLMGNIYTHFTGKEDPRMGKALTEVALAGERLVTGSLRGIGNGTGAIAAGSGILGRALPTLGIGLSALDVWKGWHELKSHEGGPLSLLGSKTARSGLLGMFASASLFVPGAGPMISGIGARLLAAANELDAFSFLDKPTTEPLDERDPNKAKLLHPFDSTPTVSTDRDPSRVRDAYLRYQEQRGSMSTSQAVAAAMAKSRTEPLLLPA